MKKIFGSIFALTFITFAIYLSININLYSFNLLDLSKKRNLLLPKKSIKSPQPPHFNTFKFDILINLYLNTKNEVNWLYYEKLKMLNQPATAIIKYTPKNSIPKKITFYNNQLWLSVFDKRVSKFLVVYIDDGFDGFVVKNQDTIFDRVAIMGPQGEIQTLNSTFTRNPNEIKFEIPGARFITMNKNTYMDYLNSAINQAHDTSFIDSL